MSSGGWFIAGAIAGYVLALAAIGLGIIYQAVKKPVRMGDEP